MKQLHARGLATACRALQIGLALCLTWSATALAQAPAAPDKPAVEKPAAAQPDEPSAAAQPDPKEKATWHFKAAKAAFLARRLDEALAELRTVMELDPQPVVMYNVARVLEEKGETTQAVEWYLKALRSGLSGELATSATARAEVLAKLGPGATSAGDAVFSVIVPEPEARIFLDGKQMGQGSLRNMPVMSGNHKVTVEHPSFQKWEKEVTLAAGDKLVVDVTLIAIEKVGFLSVLSPIAGAALSVDSQPAGLLPVENLSLTPGRHTVRVEAEGYDPFVTEVNVQERAAVVVNAALAETDNSGRLLVEVSVPGAQVTVDGQGIGYAPVEAVKLKPGPHAVGVTAPGYNMYRKDVILPPRQFMMLPVDMIALYPGSAPGTGGTGGGAAAPRYDSYVSALFGYEHIPAGLKDDPEQSLSRNNLLLGIGYAPRGFDAGMEWRFWGGARLPIAGETEGAVLSPHKALGAGMLMYLEFTIMRRVNLYGGGGIQYFYNFKGDDKDRVDYKAWHELDSPVGGGVAVRVWDMIIVNPEFCWVFALPELTGDDLDPMHSKRSFWMFRLGVGYAYEEEY